jgi:putative membrane protein
MRICIPLLLLLGWPNIILAHGGEAAPENMVQWQWEPLMVGSVALPLLMYGIGTLRLWRRMRVRHGGGQMATSCFLAGWLVLVMALLSPLHPLGNHLFFAHMIQHELLMIAAAPLLILGRPLVPMLWALPYGARRAVGWVMRSRPWRAVAGMLANPLIAWLVHALALWLWHIPSWFEAALDGEFVHALQHVSFLGTALLFWHAIVYGRRGAMSYGASVLFLFTTALHSGTLGALLTLTKTLWYPTYAARAPAWGFAPLEDQQLGGLIMWIPAGLVYLIGGLALFSAWLGASETSAHERGNEASSTAATSAPLDACKGASPNEVIVP